MKKRIILAANPSFVTYLEKGFWAQFEEVLKRRGWVLANHAMRKIPDSDTNISIPARLADVEKFFPDPPLGHPITRLPDWISADNFETLVQWEMRRWEYLRPTFATSVGLHKLVWHVDGLFRVLKPAATIVTNKIDHGTALFDWAARHYGSQVVFFERSPFDTFIAEPDGMFVESEIWDRYPQRDETFDERRSVSGREILDYLCDNPDGFRAQNHHEVLASKKLSNLKGPIFFLPMDNVLWTGWAQDNHWQRNVDYYPGTPNPSETIRRLGEIAGSLGGTLVVKLHPSDVEPHPRSLPNVLFLDTSLSLLLEACDVCVCFLTKIAFVSLSMGRPTVTLAPNTAAASKATFHAATLDDWENVISQALITKETSEQSRKAAIFFAWLQDEIYVTSGAPVQSTRPNVESLVDKICNGPAGSKSFGNYRMLRRDVTRVKSKIAGRKNWIISGVEQDIESIQEISIVFDVSRLANTRLLNSGISRYALRLLDALQSLDGVTVIPTLAWPGILDRGEFKNNLDDFSEFLGTRVLPLDQALQSASGSKESTVFFSPYDPLPTLERAEELPRIVTIHDVLHISRPYLYPDGAPADHIKNVIESLTVMDWIITDSEFTRMELGQIIEHPEDQSRTVVLAASEVFSPAPEQEIKTFRAKHGIGEAPFFVVFAQNDPRKNYSMMATAVEHFLRKHSDTECYFIVMQSAVSSTQIFSFPAEVEDRLIVISSPSDEVLATAYSDARALLYVSRGEGFGLPPLEAMQCGCPVITTSLSSIPEVTGDAALYVDPDSVWQISDAIHALLSESLWEQLRSRALERSRNFSWERTALEMLDLAKRALAEAGPSYPYDPIFESCEALQRTNTEWDVVSGVLTPSGKFFDLGNGRQPVQIFTEDTAESVHALRQIFEWRIQPSERSPNVIVSFMARALERRNVVVWVEPCHGTEVISQTEVYVDLNAAECRAQRVTMRNQIEAISIDTLAGGWRHVRLDLVLPDTSATHIRLSIGARSQATGSSQYRGQKMACFEIAGTLVLVPDEAAD